MTESNGDIRSLITDRQRKKVPPRDISLHPKEITTSDTISKSEDASTLKIELDTLPKLGKRLAVNLEEDIRAKLMEVCGNSGITPDTLIEAAIVLLQDRPEELSQVVDDAQVRLARRKRAGVIRRTLTMMDRYASES